jgi:hypothetical protein
MVPRSMRVRLAMAALMVAGYLAAAPCVVNGDGLGYLKAAESGTVYPGHLAYVPLLAGVRRLTGSTTARGLLWPARTLSALALAAAALAVAAVAGRRGGERAARVAMVGLAASWGALAAGSDVESYAPALAALAVAWWCADGEARPLGAGLATAAAALFHVENVLFGLPLLALLPRRSWPRFVAAAALPVAAAYAALAATRGAGALAGASHGLHYPLRAANLGIAVYGACKALVYAPYPYEASWARVLGCFAAGALAAAVLATTMCAPLPRRAWAAWVVPYVLVGVAFYASDAERWIFLLPLAWVAAATGAHPRRALAVAGALVVVNAVVWLPVARDGSLRQRAEAAGRLMGDGDLVIGPGHGWDEYIGFYGPRVESVPLVYWAGAVGRQGLAPTLAEKVAATRSRGRAVFLARLADDGDPMGWKELTQFALTPATVRALLPPGRPIPVADGLERLDPR